MKGQKVVVVHDSTRSDNFCWPAIKWIPRGFNLQPGDELILLGVLSLVDYSLIKGGSMLFGCNRRLSFDPVFRSNSLIIDEELARKKEQYCNHIEMRIFSNQCQKEKIKFHLELQAGASRKVVAVKASMDLGATWVILDQELKKHKKYFIDRLSCGLSRVKSNNTIKLLRGPISKKLRTSILYDEMVPGETWEEFPTSPPSQIKSSSFELMEEGNLRTILQLEGGEKPMHHFLKGVKTGEAETSDHVVALSGKQKTQHQREGEGMVIIWGEDLFKNYKCKVCNNRRPKIGWYRDFSYDELHEATEGFPPRNYLSEGGFGSVFKGQLRNGMQIAVKHHKDGSLQGEKEFKSEVDVLRQFRHQNLVMLLGSCSEGSRRLLVYEYVCNGSLDQHLSQKAEIALTWEKRIKIAMGAAKGLEYLHSKNIIHRDMNSNNILITHDHEALLGDFGLARVQHDGSLHASNNSLAGTVGYFAPEYAESGELSTKTDVYSFGVVLLQLITGLAIFDNELQDKSLVGWAIPLLEEKNYPDLVDKRIMDSYDIHQLYCMVKVAEKCLSNDPDDRCTMKEVVIALNDTIRDGDAI